MTASSRLAWTATLWVLAAGAMAADAPHRYTLPGHGSFLMPVPAGWQETAQKPEGELPPTLNYSVTGGEHFLVLVTPLWSLGKVAGYPTEADVREVVEHSAHEAEAQSVEGHLPLKGFSGASGNGYFFQATDRAPKPDEYAYLTQGALRVGNLNVIFTVLTDSSASPVIAQALSMLKAARTRD